MKFPETWNLDRIYEGGSSSSSFQNCFQTIMETINTLKTLLKDKNLKEVIPLSQEISFSLREMKAFVECLNAQDVNDSDAATLTGQMRTLCTIFSNFELELDESLGSIPDQEFSKLLKTYPEISFHLEEKRKKAKDKLPFEKEAFINDLAIDGYHGWSELWDARIGEMSFAFENEDLSFGQIENKLADPDRKRRKEGFESIQKEFSASANLFSQTLNHLGGFRLEVYKKRGWDLLKEPLDENRMKKETLDAMWKAIGNLQPSLKEYLTCKSALLGIEKMSWYDLEAPITTTSKEISYQTAAETILKQFESFSPKMAAFAKRALENHWIDAEDRLGKRPGGFCVALPLAKESRIFMTFSKTMTNLFTLAHELGHAFHNEIVFPLTEMDQDAKMGVAETASTMAEMIVTMATIKEEKDPRERLFLLDDHLSRAVSYLMNIQARFLFETRFYEKRKREFVSHEELSEIMEEAQKEAYGNSLETYHPHFWAAKMHFFFTDVPFYNFPYTFGYLFSLGIYNHAMKKGDFESSYIALLEDTGRMRVEDLATKHLQTNLSQSQFWDEGLSVIKKDIDEYIKLSKEVIL
ncbi:MAG: M3 family oligoendopeptidase [Simkaniaceae bacterium]|nr:MAG: M3 family oligoendopeptidase [Simkaniaceae bacterium]